MILKIKMLSDENDRFLREWECRADMTLLDLNDWIDDLLEYDNSVITSFYVSDGEWERGQQFTSEDMGDEAIGLMADVQLGVILHQKGDRLIYVFDPFGDRAYYMEVVDTVKFNPAESYPRLVEWSGDAPDQFDASLDAEPQDEDIFGDAFDEFYGFEGED